MLALIYSEKSFCLKTGLKFLSFFYKPFVSVNLFKSTNLAPLRRIINNIFFATHQNSMTQQQLKQQIEILNTRLHATQEALNTSLKEVSEYRQIVENAKSVIIKISLKGEIEYINPFAKNLFGPISNNDVTRTILYSVLDFDSDEPKAPELLIMQSKLNTLQLWQHEKRVSSYEGREVWISWNIKLLRDEEEQPEAFIAIGTDITKRKMAEEAMRESEYNLRKAQEVAKIGSWAWEIDTDYINCSDYFFQIFGTKPTSSYSFLINQLNKIIHPEYRKYINQKIGRAKEKGTTEAFTYKISHPSGKQQWIMEEISLLGDINKRKQMLIGTVRDITEQKMAEDKLKEYLLIVSSSSELMSLIDKNYKYVNVNQAYLEAYKKKAAEIEGHTVAEMFGRHNFDTLIKPNIDRCLLGEHLTDKYWFTFPDGRECFMDVKYNPVLEVDGTISGVTVSARDITDLKKTEDQLRIFKLFAEESGVGFGMADLKGNITYVNSKLLKMAGFQSPSDLIGKNIGHTYLKNHKKAINSKILPQIKESGHWTGEIDLPHPDGSIIYTLQNFFIIRDENEKPVSYAVTITDITDSKMAEAALKKSENNFRTIFTNAAVGIDVVDEKGNFLQVNKALANMFGYTIEELKKLDVNKVTYPNDQQKTKENLKSLFGGKNNFYRTQKRYVRINGEVFWADISVTNYEDVESKQKLAIGTITDITESKLLQEELSQSREVAIEANKAKSEFLANMSHEIRTPLNAVIGFTELLESIVEDKRQRSYLQSIKAGGKNLLLLINDILDLSKIEAGRLEFNYEAINPYVLIDEVKQIFTIKIAEKDIDFIVTVDDDIPKCLILDEVRIRQVLFNLIGNAVKFTETGFVKFSVHKLGVDPATGRVNLQFEVEDTGIGIPISQQEKIFDAFQQQSGQNTRKYGGTGLGLSISKRLVEMMSGQIWLKSQPGKGSIFSFTLTNIAIGAAVDTKSTTEDLDVDNIIFEDAKILIVDDVESNRRIISENFLMHNIELSEADDGHKAVAMAARINPDVIFMDIRMPVMDGFEAAKIIKSKRKTAKTKIIALTASIRSEDQNELYDKYFDGFLSKPVTRSDLYSELMKHIKYSEKFIHNPKIPESVVKTQSISQTTINPEEKIKLLEILRNELWQKWDKANTFQMSDEIEILAESMIATGEKFKIDIPSSWGKNLAEAVESFDLETMDKLLKSYPALVQTIDNLPTR
jgi:PAS domain S-box-containing protein